MDRLRADLSRDIIILKVVNPLNKCNDDIELLHIAQQRVPREVSKAGPGPSTLLSGNALGIEAGSPSNQTQVVGELPGGGGTEGRRRKY